MNFFGDEHIHVFDIHVKFRDEMIFLLICTKKDKITALKTFFEISIWSLDLSFLHRAEQKLFHQEILHEC